MPYLAEITDRATRDLEKIYRAIEADSSEGAFQWFNGLEAAINSLEKYPARGTEVPERRTLRHLFYGREPHVYRIIYRITTIERLVTVLHIRHGVRKR